MDKQFYESSCRSKHVTLTLIPTDVNARDLISRLRITTNTLICVHDPHTWSPQIIELVRNKMPNHNVHSIVNISEKDDDERVKKIQTFKTSTSNILCVKGVPELSSDLKELECDGNIIYINFAPHLFRRSVLNAVGLTKHFIHIFLSHEADTDELQDLKNILPNLRFYQPENVTSEQIYFPQFFFAPRNKKHEDDEIL